MGHCATFITVKMSWGKKECQEAIYNFNYLLSNYSSLVVTND